MPTTSMGGARPLDPERAQSYKSARSFSTVSSDTDDSRFGNVVAGGAESSSREPSIAASSFSSRRVPFPESKFSPSPPSGDAGAGGGDSTPSKPRPLPRSLGSNNETPQMPSMAGRAEVPVELMPDSLFCRSTFSALEHSAGTLKRLAKHVLTSTATVRALLEQLESAEDELLAGLGDLGRWLEGGYGVTGDVFDEDSGIRKVARERRAREREELEVMVAHHLEAVKSEVKRQGLAGAGAQAKFETVAKQYYQSTGAYLAPTSTGNNSPESASDAVQALRTAQFDLVRYNHHSTLLYAVPPSSVGCLDLLVGLYGWVGAGLSQVPGKRADTHPPMPMMAEDFGHSSETATPTQRGRHLAASETPVRILARDDAGVRGSVDALTRTLALSLAHLVQVRHDLLKGWAARDQETTLLEDHVRRLAEQVPDAASRASMTLGSGDASPAQAKEHKPRRRLGGKIRGLFGSSSSSTPASAPLPTLVERAPPVRSSPVSATPVSTPPVSTPPVATPPISSESTPAKTSTTTTTAPDTPPEVAAKRKSVDLSTAPTGPLPPIPATKPPLRGPRLSLPVKQLDTSGLPIPPPRPPRSGSRPGPASNRHSLQVPGHWYRSPFVDDPSQGLPRRSTDRNSVLAETAAKLNGQQPSVAGVGGLDGTGDEDEQREQVGRKKEGVLWGTGTWEELDKGAARSKWDRLWVVLAHSNIYEHRDIGPNKDAATTVIDLKFASVREGRGTDRRFVFEIVTPSHGRRLYQATTEADMKTWIYAICNAIESCINGMSTVRSSDLRAMAADSSGPDYTKALRKAGSDSKADRRLPIPPTPPRHTSTPVNRHSMPPPARTEMLVSATAPAVPSPKDHKRASLKNRIRQSAEMAGDKFSHAVGGSSNRSSMEILRPTFLAQSGRMPSYQNTGSGKRLSWNDTADLDIERRVYEMAGMQRFSDPSVDKLGVDSARIRRSPGASPLSPPAVLPAELPVPGRPASTASTGTHSETDAQVHAQVHAQAQPKLDMAHLKQIADTGANQRCADCGRRMKSSRWATLSLRDMPMVMFLCIRCCGLHRGLGTHISKPRSVDLDNWSPESILLAQQWGNERGNAMWEALKPGQVTATDDDIFEYIQAKYVEGRWLTDHDRRMVGLLARGQAL